MTAVTQEKLKEVTDKIVKEFNPEKIILFGSYAWGTPTKDSDIDLFIVKNENKTSLEMMREVSEIFFKRDFAMDILVYTQEELEKSINQNHNLFIEDIARNGRVLYTRPGSEVITMPQRILTVL